MENFNKNWLAILLIAVIFGTLGFLLGRTTGHPHHEEKRMVWKQKGHPMDSVEIKVDVETEGSVDVEVTTDTIVKDGKQIIIKEVKKIKQ